MAAIPLAWRYPALSRWEAIREEEYDQQWLEAGVYRFICQHCDEIISSNEPKVYDVRLFLICPKCKRRNIC